MRSKSRHTSDDQPIGGAREVSGWRIRGLFLFIMVVLAVLLFVPELLTRQSMSLRRGLIETASPVAANINDLELAMAAEMATMHMHVITGDERYLQHFLEAYGRAEQFADSLRRMAPRMGDEVTETMQVLLQRRALWIEPNLAFVERRISPEVFHTRLAVQQERFRAMLDAANALDARVAAIVQANRRNIHQMEQRRRLVTGVLGVLAFLAAAAALWLGHRLQQTLRDVSRRAEEEATMRRIAQLITESRDLREALQHIARESMEVAGADGSHVEVVDFDREELEVVAASGMGAPSLGATAPYPGSLCEEVMEHGEPVHSSVPAALERGKPMSPYMVEACPGCRLLVVPLVSEGLALGALKLYRKGTRPTFGSEEVQRIRLLADMAVLAVRRLYLLEQVRRSQEALRRSAQELQELNETLEEQVRERTKQVQTLASELTLAEQRERHRVAGVLHDNLQQLLYALQLQLQITSRKARSSGERVMEESLARATDLVGEAVRATRNLAVDLSPPVLEGEGLVEALQWLATHMRDRFRLDVELHVQDTRTVPSENMRVLLFHTVREILFNVVKHANTDRVRITIAEGNENLTIEVVDRGVGFEPEATLQAARQPGSRGLRTVRERIRLFGGRLDVDSEPGRGTRIRITMPTQSLQLQ